MKIRYCTTPEHVIDFNTWHTMRSRTIRSLIAFVLVVLAALTLLSLWLARAQDGELDVVTVIVTVVPPVLLVAAFLLSFRALTRLLLRWSFREGSNAAVLGERTLELTDTGVLERSEAGETLTRWSAVGPVATHGDFVYVYLSAWSAHLVPRSAFASDEERERFVATVEQRAREAR